MCQQRHYADGIPRQQNQHLHLPAPFQSYLRTVCRPMVEGNDESGTSEPFTPGDNSAWKPVKEEPSTKASSLSPRAGRLTTNTFSNYP